MCPCTGTWALKPHWNHTPQSVHYTLILQNGCRLLYCNEDRTTAQQTRDALLSWLHNSGISSPLISGQQKLCTASIREWNSYVRSARRVVEKLHHCVWWGWPDSCGFYMWPLPFAWMCPCIVSVFLSVRSVCPSSEGVRCFSEIKLGLTQVPSWCLAQSHYTKVSSSSSNSTERIHPLLFWLFLCCYPPCHDSWLWAFCSSQARGHHRHEPPNKTQVCLLQDTKPAASPLPLSASENERSLSEKMSL